MHSYSFYGIQEPISQEAQISQDSQANFCEIGSNEIEMASLFEGYQEEESIIE